jgi:S1-C subfamily serine protease
MPLELRITGGARAGTSERFDKSVIAIGRHPLSDLRFDAAKDLDVSARHAEIRSVGDRHVLHDLGSTNGTYVNGQRVEGERELKDGDVLLFGVDGPRVNVHVRPAAAAGTVAGRAATPPRGNDAPGKARGTAPGKAPPAMAAPPAPAPPAARAPAAPRQPTEVRIAHAVQQQTGRLRQMVMGLAALVVIGGALTFWMLQRASAENRAQLGRLLASNDSLARALELRLAQTGIADSALKTARAESERLAAELRARQQSGGDITALSAEMRTAQARTATIARMDYAAIAAANKAAMAFLVVEMPDSSRASGTGFNLLPSGLIATNRHVVQAADGTRAQRVAVAFDGTRGRWLEATVEYVSETDEIAFLRIRRPGPFPVIAGIAADAGSSALGEPVGILGYPLGTELVGMGGDINTLRPTATLGFGTVSKVLDDALQLDAYAAQGSSGSPVFDARGLVVGVVYGGASESNGRIVYAVPAARLIRQLPTDARAVVR